MKVYLYTHDGKADFNTSQGEVKKWHADWTLADTVLDQGGSALKNPIAEESFINDYNGVVSLNAAGAVVLGRTTDEINKEKAQEIRCQRDIKIQSVEWRLRRHETQTAAGIETTDSAANYLALLEYVQSLRDVPEQKTFPASVTWPELSI